MKPNSQKRRCAKMRLNIQPPWFLTKWTAVGPNPSTRMASRWDCVSDALSIVLVFGFAGAGGTEGGGGSKRVAAGCGAALLPCRHKGPPCRH